MDHHLDQRAELGDFLRTCRARLRPEDVGLPDYGRRRRVPGLRREELAQLAGVSVAYYTRLEQGHGHNVSAEVLDAVARALRLGDTETAHLNHLASPRIRRGGRSRRPQQVRPELRTLLDAMEGVPAYLVGRRQDVIGWNRLAAAVFGDFGAHPPAERNLVRLVFLDPATAELYADWECRACEVVSNLRLYAGQHPDDEQLTALVGELSVKNEEFRRLWAAHTVADKTHGVKQLRHPLVGELELSFETLTLPDDPAQFLVTFHAAPGSPSADALRLLSSWTAPMPPPTASGPAPAPAPAPGEERV
ncbi:transcriptional regulator with XRE-family HTH domain [Streptomyces sp. 3211.6]|uniref:helix-turn-helix transcriptional regulator n=1 Tax=unclassified Streptomyces TaxID=2593676 RepID=UPI000F101E1D|nr:MULTISPECIES: helix-turn-helix transcriptional regulator [unclassified Streptomyces]RKT06542.1 transcriptional regulator with XRE-family HTH domain [Streptomyces sp. 3211.6]RPF45924.1 transcriptional regulator with XRE-family HTH domain [Streptomyces sp. Ag109_G2-6]